MKKVNLIIVLNPDQTQVLMCHRQKDPYKGQFNFVGGKLEPNESNLDGAYRELFEETGIMRDAIAIKPLFFSEYFEDNLELQVYYGTLKYPVELIKEVNPLLWIDLKTDFTDTKFAGDGNIQHMMKCIEYSLNTK